MQTLFRYCSFWPKIQIFLPLPAKASVTLTRSSASLCRDCPSLYFCSGLVSLSSEVLSLAIGVLSGSLDVLSSRPPQAFPGFQLPHIPDQYFLPKLDFRDIHTQCSLFRPSSTYSQIQYFPKVAHCSLHETHPTSCSSSPQKQPQATLSSKAVQHHL